MLPSLPTLKEVIDKHGLFTRKSLGQHFLLDSRITDKIVLYAGDLQDYNVIEIGSGPGGLTRSLLSTGAKSLTVVEKDDRGIAVMEELAQHWNDGRLKIIHGDALKTNLIENVPAPRKIVANLPYNVGTQLLLNWLDDVAIYGLKSYRSMTLMFQDEVASRIIAAPDTGEYGRLSVISQFLCECRYDFQLPPGAFFPPPKVNSAVITLTPHEKPLFPVSKNALEKVVATAFGQRRKMLRSALKPLGVPVETLLDKAGIDGTLRAEVLDVPTFCKLAQVYEDMKRLLNMHDFFK
jgi:16S rRNA (adenine1518-N6/adenine1519-N6)-dimethyltransferase